MKVLVVTNMYPTAEEPWRGSFVHEQVAALQGLGIEADVQTFDGRVGKAEYLRAARGLRRRVASGAFDVIHAHYGLTGAVALFQRRVPVVTTFWGSETGYVAWQAVISRIVGRATTPIFVSRHNAVAVGLPDAEVIPSAVDTTVFAPRDRVAARVELGWEADATYALFPGAPLNVRKRPDLFDAGVTFARSGLPDLQAVYLSGYSRAETVAVMNAVDVTVMTSDWEGSPLAVKESLACCTPVVSVEVGDVAETVVGLPSCALVPRDPAAIGRAIIAAIRSERDDALRVRAAQYEAERLARRVASVYEAVCNR